MGLEPSMPSIRQLSPVGRSAICVLRIDGPGYLAALHSLGCDELPDAITFTLRRLTLPKRRWTERALLLVLEDAVEIHVHGNPLLVDALLDELPATRTTASARGLKNVIQSLATQAVSPTALEACLYQLCPKGLLGLVADLAQGSFAAAPSRIDACIAAWKELEPWIVPAKVLLRGRVNAGKSTLMNLLLGRQRVRAGPLAALTRDPVAEAMLLQGLPILLIDSAGISEAQDPLDVQAMELAESLELQSACSIWLVSTTEVLLAQAKEAELRIWTHADLASAPSAYRDELAFDLLTVDAAVLRDLFGTMLREKLGIRTEPSLAFAACLCEEQAMALTAIRRAVADERLAEARQLAKELLVGANTNG